MAKVDIVWQKCITIIIERSHISTDAYNAANIDIANWYPDKYVLPTVMSKSLFKSLVCQSLKSEKTQNGF